MTKRIVAAVDGSPASLAALRWAFRMAAATGSVLEAVHAVARQSRTIPSRSGDEDVEAAARIHQSRVLAALPGVADSESPVRVIISAPGGPLVRTLAQASRGASMIVVGEPQCAEHADLPEQLAATCPCEVVAVTDKDEVRHVSPDLYQRTR